MSTTIGTNNNRYYETPGILATGAGVWVGSTASNLVSRTAATSTSIIAIKKAQDINKNNVSAIQKGLNNALEISGMKNKGVKIVDYANKEFTILDIHKIIIDKSKNLYIKLKDSLKTKDLNGIKLTLKEDYKEINNVRETNIKSMIAEGQNAFYTFKSNTIHINSKKLGVLGFHEIGHSINFNSSKFWKSMHKIRPLCMAVSGLIGAVALFKRKKAEGEKPEGIIDRATTFIKNNAGKLTLLSMAPVVAEELKATQRGNALAKKLLSPELAKKVAKCNKYAAISYIAHAGGTALGITIGSKIRDAIAGPKEVKTVA